MGEDMATALVRGDSYRPMQDEPLSFEGPLSNSVDYMAGSPEEVLE